MQRWAQRLGDGARRRHRPRGGLDPGRLGRSARRPNLEYRVMQAANLPVRRRRVRPGERDRGARARARPRAHGRRDGALRRAPPARVGPARAAVADAEHGARRLLARARQHARATSTTGPGARSWSCSRATARSSRCARRSPGRCCLSASRVSAGRPTRSYGSGARILSIGIASTGLLTFAYFSIASHVLERTRGQAHRPAVVGDVRDHLGDLPADRTAALAHDRRPPRARPRRALAARADRDPGRLRARSSWSLALALHGELAEARLRPLRRRSTACWWSGTLAYAASYFARGWLAGHSTSRCTAASC